MKHFSYVLYVGFHTQRNLFHKQNVLFFGHSRITFYILVQQIERIIYTESNGVGALRKPLLVSFRGEEARDANTASSAGVRREFFMLLLQNLLNPDYGMIKEDEESNLSWFRDSDDNSEITLR